MARAAADAGTQASGASIVYSVAQLTRHQASGTTRHSQVATLPDDMVKSPSVAITVGSGANPTISVQAHEPNVASGWIHQSQAN
jgi:hypothetical protein